ncbi:MAG: response regulator [Gemmatimonadales bacterium]
MALSDPAKDTILVIDDEDDVRRILAKLLEREGFHTLQARDGSEAIHIFAEHAGEIAAVTLDLTMPTTNGHEALKMLSEYDPRLPIVVATALPLPNNLMGRVPGTRGVGYIQKPFSSSALAQELRRVIAEMQGD